MQFKLNFALVAIAIAAASANAMPTRGYASDSNDLAARATADDLAYLEARYGADVDVNEFFGREDEADLFARDDDADSLFARDDDADSLFARDDDADSLFAREDDTASLYAREDEGELFAREDEGELFAREDGEDLFARDYEEDLWAREDDAEFYARDLAAMVNSPTAAPGTPAHGAEPDNTIPSKNPFKPTDADGLAGWKMMKAVMAREKDPLPENQAHGFTQMREGCKRITKPELATHCQKVVKHLETAAGEQLWGFRTYLEMTSNPIPVTVLPYLSQIHPHGEKINKRLAPGLTAMKGVPTPKV